MGATQFPSNLYPQCLSSGVTQEKPALSLIHVNGRRLLANSLRIINGPGILETTMLDLIFVAAIVGFFALSIAYVYACDRL